MPDVRSQVVTLPLYSETQYFSRWWLLVAIAPPAVPFIMLVRELPNDEIVPVLYIIGVVVSIVSIFIYISNLKVEQFEEAIGYKMSPFGRRHFIKFQDMRKIYVRSFDPMGEFGGWGAKWGMDGGRNNRCYTTRGKNGIQIELKDSRKIILGTQKPDQWKKIISETFSHQAV